MDNDNASLMPKPSNAEQKRLRWLNFMDRWMDQFAAAYRQQITMETKAMYLNGLYDLPIDRLELAFQKALREFVPGYGILIPPIGLIRQLESTVEVPPERIEAAHKRLRERLAAQPPIPMLKSVVDEAPKPKREFKPLSTEETERRLKELLKQAQELKNAG